ncbi:uncharacterized protein [Leuresthes tenuis]|uniref:uncharacterized protein n=1 Tax=Leuresthes tenuis TaxID=355514 RepID=UPI003B502C42
MGRFGSSLTRFGGQKPRRVEQGVPQRYEPLYAGARSVYTVAPRDRALIPATKPEPFCHTLMDQYRVTPADTWPTVVSLNQQSQGSSLGSYPGSSVSQHALGVQVEVFEGETSVLLPCRVAVTVSNGSTVVWDRGDLKISTVHVRRPAGDYLKDQNQMYRDRTSVQAGALQTGDVSLTLRKPTFTDGGKYTCTIRRMGEDLSQTAIHLQVRVCQAETVELTEGKKSVLLPFKTKPGLPEGVRVEWSCSNHEQLVHVYQNQSGEQVYLGRTEMREDPLKTGDLSLCLKEPRLNDSGAYKCTVFRARRILLQKVVTLSIRESLLEKVKVTEGEEFVLLPFKVASNLPDDVRVTWRRTDKDEAVHEYPRHQNQSDTLSRILEDYQGRTEMTEDRVRTGDLSVTLKVPRVSDSSIYICSVYNSEGTVLRQKMVTLTVSTVSQAQVLEVRKGARSVWLPFKTAPHLLCQDVTVEWRCSKPENTVIHVYREHRHHRHQDYQGHTEMGDDPLTTGDLSLRLIDLNLTDDFYICTIYDNRGKVLKQKVVGLSIKVYEMEIVEVPKGEKSVQLPFKTAALSEDARVEWRHPDSKRTDVLTYENGDIRPEKQDKVYRGRTEMDKDRMKNGDLSLTLTNPIHNDNGLYTCTVYKGGDILLHKLMILSVRESSSINFIEQIPRYKRTRPRNPSAPPLQAHLLQAPPLQAPLLEAPPLETLP